MVQKLKDARAPHYLWVAISIVVLIGAWSSATWASPAAPTSHELLVYDLNRNVTKADRGFPRDQPPMASANGDWTAPVNYAEGTVYYRLEIRNQPEPQDMIIQLCFWQYNLTLENCGKKVAIQGNPGTVITWAHEVTKMYKKGGKSIDWKNPRQRYGLAIKTSTGAPVSDIKDFNWGGQDPDKWYPLNMRFTAVVVEKGGTFSGWHNYVGGEQNPTATPTTPPAPTNTPTPSETPPSTGENVVVNGDFENGQNPWSFKASGSYGLVNSAVNGTKAAQLTFDKKVKNMQFYQIGLPLEANADYRLTFRAYASSGNDMQVYLHRHNKPNTNFGLGKLIRLGTSWEQHLVEFTTKGFSGTTSDSRLRFWFASTAQAGDRYFLDDIRLERLDGGTGASRTIVVDTSTPVDSDHWSMNGLATFGDSAYGVVFLDLDGNGEQGLDEPGLSNMVVEIRTVDGETLHRLTTDESGSYATPNLDAGSYHAVLLDTDGVTLVQTVAFVHDEDADVSGLTVQAAEKVFLPMLAR